MDPCVCGDKPTIPSRTVWTDFKKAQHEKYIQRCRELLNSYYETDFFSIDAKHNCTRCIRRAKPGKQWPAEEEMENVRTLTPPYWDLVATGRKKPLQNPFNFTRRYGEKPNPTPWKLHAEALMPPCVVKKANVGFHPDCVPLRPVIHKFAWDPDTDTDTSHCNLWHCKLIHKKSMNDRPYTRTTKAFPNI